MAPPTPADVRVRLTCASLSETLESRERRILVLILSSFAGKARERWMLFLLFVHLCGRVRE